MTYNYRLLLFFGILLSIFVIAGGQWGPPEFDFGGPGPGFGGMGFGGPGFGFGRPPPWVRRAWRRRFCFRNPDHPRCWGMPPPDFGAPPPPPPSGKVGK
uniref:Uncharacterized protein n=1 Tax=Panagrolaimus davidi TaxID=227884 RepID=A0A914R4J7_9BILA